MGGAAILNVRIPDTIIGGAPMMKAFVAIGEVDSEAVKFAMVVEGVTGNGWAAGAVGNMLYVTPAVLSRIGVTLEELTSEDRPPEEGWKRIVHPEDCDRFMEVWRRCLRTGDQFSVDHRVLRGGGAYHWCRTSGRPLHDTDGAIGAWYGTSIDADASRAARERFAEIPRAMSDNPRASNVPEVLGRVHPDDRVAAAHAAARAFWTGVPQITRHRQLQDSGSYRWTETRSEPGYHISVDIDDLVTEREPPPKDPPGALSDTDPHRSAQVVCSIFGNGWAFDASGRWIYLHDFAKNSLGVTLSELNAPVEQGHTAWKRVLYPDDYDRVSAIWRRCLETGDDFNVEFRFQRASGAYVWARTAARATRDLEGRITGWFGIALDIDVYKRTVVALREREQFLMQLVETLPAMIDCAAPDGEPVYRSRQLRHFLGYELKNLDAAGKARLEGTLDASVHPDDVAGVKEHYARCLETGEPYSRRHRLRRFDGEYRWVETRAAPIRDADGVIIQWNVICLDIEGEVRAQDELRLAQERLTRASQAASFAELSASIAHEVNQPLAAIVANSHACQRWLSADPPNMERARRSVDRVIRDANSASEVVNRVRALFNRSVVKRVLTAVGGIIREACDLMDGEARRGDVRIEIEIDGELPPVALDRVQIQQVLVNLIRNGMEAMHGNVGGKVLNVRARRQNGCVQIEVRDVGSGIEFSEKIFEPFFTTKEQGMGMGLAICKSIVESHGGRLRAERNNPQGAVFIFTLPLE